MRSKSVPPNWLGSKSEEDDKEETEQFPALLEDAAVPLAHNHWLRELALARAGRQSRASSIVSTRTRFSTTTFDDARSIDIIAGGHTFRISRDASYITDTTAPPPYPGSIASDMDDERSEHVLRQRDDETFDDRDDASVVSREPRKRVRIAMPNPEDSAEEDESGPSDTPSRVITKQELHQVLLDLPLRLKRALGISGDSSGMTDPASIISNVMSDSAMIGAIQKDEREVSLPNNPVRTPGLGRPGILKPQNWKLLSLGSTPGPSGRLRDQESDSFPESRDLALEPPVPDLENNGRDVLEESTETVKAKSPVKDDVTIPMTVGDLNELSLLYNGVIRDLDREHRKQLHERDKEMAQLRTLLNEKDIVYRQQLRGKDFIIDDLKKQLDLHEDRFEVELEKARNQVEDMWEVRWRDRDRHLTERMRRMESASEQARPGTIDRVDESKGG